MDIHRAWQMCLGKTCRFPCVDEDYWSGLNQLCQFIW